MDLDGLTKRLLDSYETLGGLNHRESGNLPSKQTVAEICELLLCLFFPGYHDEKALEERQLQELTRLRLRSLHEKLAEEICKSLRSTERDCPRARSNDLATDFLTDLPGLRELLATDIAAAYEGDPAATGLEEIILAYPSIETVAIQRSAHHLYRAGVPLLPRVMTEWAHSRTGIDIHPGASLGTHFFIDHGTGVVIGETCRIGHHVKIYHGVTLGARSFQRDDAGKIVKGGKRHPDVGNNVTIYPNSTILGGETLIGEGTTIGANVYLMHSIPAKSLVFLEEKQVQIIPKKERANG